MKLTTLIAELESHKELHGDLDVKIQINDFNSGELFARTIEANLERTIINNQYLIFQGDVDE